MQRIAAVTRHFKLSPIPRLIPASRNYSESSSLPPPPPPPSSIDTNQAPADHRRAKILEQLAMDNRKMTDVIADAHAAGHEPWEKMYQEGVTPWDKGEIAPALAKLLAEGKVPEGRILVPGCGRGVDIFALATPTRTAVGMDIAPSAVSHCADKLAANPNPNAHFVLADFFKFTEADLPASVRHAAAPGTIPQFDALYDYTFLCALPPTMRDAWAQRVTDLVKPGGTLITLMYPLDDSRPLDDGPPFPQSVARYRELLAGKFGWVEVEMSECESFPARAGREKVALWRKKE